MHQKTIYTIGYSGFNNETKPFIDELKARNINVLIDVRSVPYSGRFDNFNKEAFSSKLKESGITYRNYSKEFGAKQLDPQFYSFFDGKDNRIDYDLFIESEAFTSGVDKLETIYRNNYKAVIMCSEKDPIDCHRAIMISRPLFQKYSFNVIHIIPGQDDESQAKLELRIEDKIKNDLLHKKKLNSLEQKMKDELEKNSTLTLFSTEDTGYTSDINNYYRILNSRIGWKYDEVLGYK